MFLEMVGEIIEEMSRSLFETVQGFLEPKNVFASADVVVLNRIPAIKFRGKIPTFNIYFTTW